MPMRIRFALVFVLVFAAGVAVGVGFSRHTQSARAVQTMDAAHLHRHLAQVLSLDSAQSATVAGILARHQHAVDSTWRMLQPEVRANLDSTLHEIMNVLRPDQASKFRKLVQVMHPGMM